MAQQQKPTKVQINEGERDGIIVINEQEQQRYIVDMPNAYDVYWQFLNKAGEPDFARRVDHPDESGKRVAFEVPWDNLMSEQAIRLFNHKVVAARKVNAELVQERQDFSDILAFDLSKPDKKAVMLWGRPTKSNFHMGQVVRTGKYYVAIASEGTDAVFCRILHGGKFLNGKDDYARREEVLAERFPVGSFKRLNWNRDGTVSLNDYVPKEAQSIVQAPSNTPAPPSTQLPAAADQVQPAEAPPVAPAAAPTPPASAREAAQPQTLPDDKPEKPELTQRQREALIAFREKNLPTWKMALGKAWLSGDYGSMSMDQAAALQQVRNEFGPQWLHRMRPEDLGISPEDHAKKLIDRAKPSSIHSTSKVKSI